MAYTNNAMSNSEISLNISQEPRGNYRGSNEFILTDNDKQKPVDQLKSIGAWFHVRLKNACKKKVLYKRVPVLDWLPKYTSEDAVGDLVAGITVGLTVIPQALAYAGIAGIPPQYGLYGSFLGCFVYIFIGSCKDVPMGPTALASLLTFQAAGGVWQRAVLLSLLTGIIEVLMGIFQLGFIIDFVSGPVGSGFTSAAAFIIITSQIKDIFGITARGNTFLAMWQSIIAHIHDANIYDSIMGISCIIILMLMRTLCNMKIGPKDDAMKSGFQKFINKLFWLIGTGRNAILVVATGCIMYFLNQTKNSEFHLIGDVPSGLPNIQIPSFSIPDIRNETTGELIKKGESFSEMIQPMGSFLIVIPLIALLEDISICKAFAKGKSVDATQELLAIGASNVLNSFVQGFPGTGSLSRGAVNNASGVRTSLGNLYTGVLVILSLMFLTPLFFYIPKSALAAIIISAVVFMVEVKVIKPMWRSKKSDLLPGLATFFACLILPLEYGIIIGIGINIIFILYHAARPKIRVEFLSTSNGTKYLMLTPDRCLIFPSVDYVKNLVNKMGVKSQVPLVLDCSHIYGADYTAATVIESLLADFTARKQLLIFYNLKPSVGQVFEGVDIDINVCYDMTTLETAINGNN